MDPKIMAAAERHGLSRGAAEVLYRALVAGGGRQAQFSHPELGGMGQWSGGMTQIGAMFDDELKAKVAGFCREVAELASHPSQTAAATDGAPKGAATGAMSGTWWPENLGRPSSTGAQNGLRYACFPERRRLAIEQGGRVTLYDTGEHRLTGFAQQQGERSSLTFSGPDGPVGLETLAIVQS